MSISHRILTGAATVAAVFVVMPMMAPDLPGPSINLRR